MRLIPFNINIHTLTFNNKIRATPSQQFKVTTMSHLSHGDVTVERSLRHQKEASPGYHDDMTVLRAHSPHTAMSL